MNYHIQVKFGDTIIPILTTNLRELTIIQDYNKFLPEFKMRLDDTSGILTHVAPFDKNMSSVYVELASSSDSLDINSFNFSVYDRTPGSSAGNASSLYDIDGLLDISGLFSPDYSRGLSGNIKTNLENISKNEFGITNTEVSEGLNYSKTLLQPQWTNAQLFNYLKDNIIGINNECSFRSFIKRYMGKSYFVFKSLSEMVGNAVSYKFVLSDKRYMDRLPIFSYYIYDNYKIYCALSSKKQAYSYFNYDTTTYTSGEEDIQSYPSLTDFFLVDKSDSEDSNSIVTTGRNNSFTSDFAGMVKGNYYNRLTNLVKMWITTEGLANIVPGQIVEIFFPHGMEAEALYSYQYSGYWIVETVIHNVGETFLTKLLLTRNGLDTDKTTTLIPASKRKT